MDLAPRKDTPNHRTGDHVTQLSKTEPDKISSTQDEDHENLSSNCIEEVLPCQDSNKKDRWKLIDLGLIQKLLKLMFKNLSDRVCGILTIWTSIALAISDTVSDFVIAITLFKNSHTTLGWVVVAVDYIPSWILATHNYCSSKWRAAETGKQKVFTMFCILLSPFAQTLFHLRWLYDFEIADQEKFEVLHHNARLSQLLSSSYESPMQITLLLIMWAQDKIELPWATDTCVTDSMGRNICLGAIPGIFSFTISLLSLVKGSLDICEGKAWTEKVIACVYSICNFSFRLPSIALAILFFNEWSLVLFIPILILNLIMILRYGPSKRKDFSVVTSFIIATVTPFISSDQTNLYQRMDIQTDSQRDITDNKHRRKLSARLSKMISPMLFISNIVLFVLLKYDPCFEYNSDIIMGRKTTMMIISIFLLPLGSLVMIANFMYSQTFTAGKIVDKNYYDVDYQLNLVKLQLKESCIEIKTRLQVTLSILLFLGLISLFGVLIHTLRSIPGKYFINILFLFIPFK